MLRLRMVFTPLLCGLFLLLTLIRTSWAEERELHVLCWSEYIPPSIIESFSQKSGTKVRAENYNSNDQMLAKLREKPGYYDLVQPSQKYVETLIQTSALRPLDTASIPNLRHLDPQYRGLPHDPESRFSVPWMAGTVGIVINTAEVRELITTWADVFSGAYRDRIVIVNDPREMAAWALASLGLPITDITDANLARITPVLERWLPQVKVFDSDSPHTALLDGRAVIGIVWSGEAALLWQKDRKFQYVLPREGAHMFLDSLAIPTDSPQPALAAAFINHCLDPEVSVQISRAYPYTNPNLAARQLLTAEERANPASYLPDNPKLLPLRNVGNENSAVEDLVQKIRARLGK